MIYHVSVCGDDNASGYADAPFRTINKAASVAVAGDTVRVHEGTYREWVQPQNGGYQEKPIIYEVAHGEHAIIKGSEVITDWALIEGTVWKKVLPNSFFGDYNPYAERMDGDWFVSPTERKEGYYIHLGEVYINGVAMFEASSIDDLYKAPIRSSGYQALSASVTEYIPEPETTRYRWYATVDEQQTTVLCNFQDVDPNEALIEINVRKACFYPTKNHLDYITVRGFEIAHAACPFTPPTSDQIGMVGPNWAKGWIIENNDIHDAKCSGISIGKEASTGDNDYLKYNRKHSHYYQTEAVFRALRLGWNRETIGSHIIRNNKIHDCGQNGVVGHLGCIFSRIEHNDIYRIATKHEFFGHEIGGIKLHAAIDVVIDNNNIHDCTLGTWLDWQAQGVRLTRNLYHHNERDLFIEVTHGPCLVDNNLFLSKYSFQDNAQGTAFVHNIVAGSVLLYKTLERQTPYHFPHSTDVLGVAQIYGGDNRIYNNLLIAEDASELRGWKPMSSCYNDHFTPKEFYSKMKDHDIRFDNSHWQAIWAGGNAYSGYASPFRAEATPIFADGMQVEISENNGEWILTLNVPQAVVDSSCEAITTDSLGAPVYTEEKYENPDGTPIDFTKDFFENARDGAIVPGPFAKLIEGKQNIVIWSAEK